MDSKSISREGVGVQVPASAPVEPADELAAALLPALLHRLNNVTQLITGVNSLVRVTGSSAPLVQCGADLDRAGGSLARLGWLVGALARGVGSDLGTERHEERALEWLLDLLAETLRREGCELVGPAALPRLAPAQGFPASWAIASWLLASARAGGKKLEWGIEREGAALIVTSSRGPAEPERLRTRLAGLVPEQLLRYEARA